MLLIPALERQRQVDLCDWEASLVYRLSSRTARAKQRNNPVSETKGVKKIKRKRKKKGRCRGGGVKGIFSVLRQSLGTREMAPWVKEPTWEKDN